MSDYSIDGMIRYFEMAHKVMGWPSTDNSYEYHVAQMLKQLRAERDEARQLFCEDRFHNGKHYRSVDGDLVICASPKEIADDLGWDCFKEGTNVESNT